VPFSFEKFPFNAGIELTSILRNKPSSEME